MKSIFFEDLEFLDVDTVKDAHEIALSRYGGGLAGIRDAGLVESAVMSPQTGYYGTIAEIAAV